MNRLVVSLLAALLASAVTAGGLYYQQRVNSREAAQLKNANGRMRMAASLARTRAQAPVSPPMATGEPAPVAAAREPLPAPVEYRNEGTVTPLATLQTFAWASDRGEVEAVGRMLHIDPSARTKAEAFLAALPAEARVRWPTVDAMAAELLTSQGINAPFPAASILALAEIESLGTDRVRLRLPGTPKDRTEYQRTAEGWKYVVTEKMVDDYVQRTRAQGTGGGG